MYFVYYGHVNSDNHDHYPTHRIAICANDEEVLATKREFDECKHTECLEVCFRIFKGTEVSLKPVTQVTSYVLEENQ